MPVPTNKKFFAGKSQNDIASNILAIFGPKLSLATVAARQDEKRRTKDAFACAQSARNFYN